ncbi:hypothetical protein B0H10DRAFT_1941688 [Mycena sp. CBHHK59/15]|nr:hypothetical protein B0H10DRAFT_1941688 [Mycena sp. CBHHK59/15]
MSKGETVQRGVCMLRLGDISKRRGDLETAVGFWRPARPLLERSSQAKDVASVDVKLAAVTQDMLTEHKKHLAHLSELRAPTEALAELPIGTTMGIKSKRKQI